LVSLNSLVGGKAGSRVPGKGAHSRASMPPPLSCPVQIYCGEPVRGGILCDELAVTWDEYRRYAVCRAHALPTEEREWLAGMLTGWAEQWVGSAR
jgi:hypothetical protein